MTTALGGCNAAGGSEMSRTSGRRTDMDRGEQQIMKQQSNVVTWNACRCSSNPWIYSR